MLKQTMRTLGRAVVWPPARHKMWGGAARAGGPASSQPDIIRRAAQAQSLRDWAAAQALWQQATQDFPEHVACWLQLGNMCNELGRHDEARAAFSAAGRLDPLGCEPLEGCAGVYERTGDWYAALKGWTALIDLLASPGRAARPDDARHLAHALLHAASNALLAEQPGLAAELMARGEQACEGFADQPGYTLLRARLLKRADPRAALAVLRPVLAADGTDDAACFEFGSLALDHGDPVEGAAIVAGAVARRPADISFLRLLTDLHSRARDWRAVCDLAQRMAAVEPRETAHLRRALDAALAMKDMVTARRLARAHVRASGGESIALHDLARAYEDAGEFDRARLLFRLLTHRWPHSDWHVARHVVLSAVRWSLPEADRLLRARIAARGRTLELDRAYCRAAFVSGNMSEAGRRLAWFIDAHPDDEDAKLFLGYVIANTEGIDAAERHFLDLGARTFQAKGALIGAAHMAMRRRDSHAVHERWATVVGVYPEDTIGHVEYARSAYEIRDIGLALQIARERLAALPTDVTMGEFYAWLLTAIGRFEDAWNYLATLRRHTGANWSVLELAVQNAAQTGRLDSDFDQILRAVPASGTRPDGRRFYHALRQLAAARRTDLIPALVDRAAIEARHLAWLAPYLHDAGATNAQSTQTAVAPQVEVRWAHARAMVRSDIADWIRKADDQDIRRVIGRPRHDQPTVHIVNKFEQVRGGSELHALDVAARVSKHAKVELWAPEMPHPHFSAACGVKSIEPGQGRVPHGGVLVMIGVYFDIIPWIRRTRPTRVIFLYNTFEAPLLFERIEEVHTYTGIMPELLYCSDMMGQEVELPGFFEPSPVDIEHFHPRPEPFAPDHRFTLGRHSRDVIEKHHAQDWKVYEAVADLGGRSILLGGTCMQRTFPDVAGLELLPARADKIVEFLQGLDCYYYNTSTWIEPWGRVVVEAMACGLPVLVSDIGGYAQMIEHGRNGLLFSTVDEAARMIRDLAADPALRRRLGAEARRSVEMLLGPAALERLVSFYLA